MTRAYLTPQILEDRNSGCLLTACPPPGCPSPRLLQKNLRSRPKMCPHTNGDSTPNDPSQMVPVDISNGTSHQTSVQSNGANGHATNGAAKSHVEQQRRNPYASRASDFLSNICNFKIIESTLRGAY
ncbi:uncharacterized protein PHACADRAFT_252052 [Phanerochaete carnosa HHB-10118-sp]|uniref:Uncharacterized protein n=1 Tax=Phanerochaete carnosa (strain HHB-10118-sp) TaxID=650164 RepID=K5WFI3_PHACS|nr:uncharacterized protein PHACADRAFT_252052 [Phanerochaete carnosa HHB-10118-sp]EKM58065.1 hypothetical protein PHACADRAFT_252052 [Phanerochaete carnosa HHB-10118-sp]